MTEKRPYKRREFGRQAKAIEIAQDVLVKGRFNGGWMTAKEMTQEMARAQHSIPIDQVTPMLCKLTREGILKRRAIPPPNGGCGDTPWVRGGCTREFRFNKEPKRPKKRAPAPLREKTIIGVADSYSDLVNAMSEARAAIKLVEEELRLIEVTMKAMHEMYQKLRELQRVIRDLG